MATHNSLFADQDVRRTETGIAVSVQLPWYRSLWLSAVDNVAASVNGVAIPTENLRFALQGREYRVEELPEQSETLWFVADRPEVLIDLGRESTQMPDVFLGKQQALFHEVGIDT